MVGGKGVEEGEVVGSDRMSAGPVSEQQERRGSRLKNLIVGVGVALIVVGVVLAVYIAAYEDEPFLIALAPTFLGIIVIVAAMFGKRR